jgi:hypothetical protein
MSLVIIRCQHCRTRLGSLDAMPDDWSGKLNVLRCRKCVIPTPRRLLGAFVRLEATGFAPTVDIPLADLRRYAIKAQRGGHAETVPLPPLPAAE